MTENPTSSPPPAKVTSLGFEQARTPFKVGQLRSKTWRAPFTNGLTDIWRRRCMEYWERIEKRYGVIFSEPRNDWVDDPIEGPCVSTFATPLAIVPGERFELPEGARMDT